MRHIIPLLMLLSAIVATFGNNQTEQFSIINFNNKHAHVELRQGILYLVEEDKIFKGILQIRIGNFSQWVFYLNNANMSTIGGSEIILNEQTKKIFNVHDSMSIDGPYLKAVSTDGNYVVFDYGTSPGPRKFIVLTNTGHKVFEGGYMNNSLKWTSRGLEYGVPQSVPLDLNPQTKACKEVGAAWLVQQFVFDGKEKKKLDVAPTIQCSN